MLGEYNNFVFYGSWRQTIDTYREKFGDAYADEILRNIVYYGTSGEILTDDPTVEALIIGMIAPNINASQERYNKAKNGGAKGGRPKKIGNSEDEQNIQIAMLKLNGYTKQEIAQELGISASTVGRREGWSNPERFKNVQNFDQNTNSYQIKSQKPDIDKDIDKEIDIETGLSSVIEQLKSQGYSQDWIEIALAQKTNAEWDKFGYGLLFTESFKQQINKLYQQKLERQKISDAYNSMVPPQRIAINVKGGIGDTKRKGQPIDLDSIVIEED